MEKNIEILQFLDGSLSHEEEAELLHRLSVSPERRDVLRSHIDQRVLFQRDREAINVPYAAEQKLWTRLGELMPAIPAATVTSGTAVGVATHGFRWLSVASIGTVCVIIGLLSGFYLGRNSTDEIASAPGVQPILAVERSVSELPTASSETSDRMVPRHRSEAPLAVSSLPADRSIDLATPAIPTVAHEAGEHALEVVTPARSRSEHGVSYSVLEPRERSRSLAGLVEATQHTERSVYPYELNFAESFGMQFPQDAASRNTQPLITNSAISGLYQVYNGSIEVWAGGSIGSANLARRVLREDPQPGGGSKIVADVNHIQTTWIGPAVQGRHRLNEQISVTASAGASYSDLGPLFYGEVGGRYDLTDQVGITLGLRSFHFQYDLSTEQENLIRHSVYKIDAGGPNYGTEWSHNLEFLTGMYFRF